MTAKIQYAEDTLVQQTTAEYLEQKPSWESVYAYKNEDFGPDSLLGCEVVRECCFAAKSPNRIVKSADFLFIRAQTCDLLLPKLTNGEVVV